MHGRAGGRLLATCHPCAHTRLRGHSLLCCAALRCPVLALQVSDPAVYKQVVARAHRMGATGPVTVQTLVLWAGKKE